LDFIGLNYYTREFVHHAKPFLKNPIGEVCGCSRHKNIGKRTDMGWEIYPRGIYETLKSFSRYNLPIFITENGVAAEDPVRKDFIKDHLAEVLKAINEGIPVIGYLYWSLLDNFEWAEGYRPRFGLVHVDYETQKRTIKDSARYFSSVIKTGKI
jgi:beta-glucosidase